MTRKVQESTWNVQDIVLEKALGSMGFMNIASVAPRATTSQDISGEGLGLGMSEIQRRAGQEVTEGGVAARLYAGCLSAIVLSRISPSKITLIF